MSAEPAEPTGRASANRYSVLRCLQQRMADACRRLPQRFASLADWRAYRARLAAALREKLPIWTPEADRRAVVRASAPLGDDLTLESVDVHFDAGFYAPVHVYRAQRAPGRLPAVLVCPGYTQRKNADDVIAMCMALARSGMVAVAVEYGGIGERADRPDPHTDINNICAAGALVGVTDVGLRVMTNLAVVRYLQACDDVDPDRLGITGLCQGSITTWYTAAVCDELAAVAPLCGVTTHEAIVLEYCNRQGGWSGISPYVWNLLEVGDIQHVVACVAPRPLFVQNNLIDIHWPLSGFEQVRRLVEHVYDLHGERDQCTFRLEHGPHAFAEPMKSNIVAWFARTFAEEGVRS